MCNWSKQMKLGIIGLPLAGKTTVFESLTRSARATGSKTEDRLEVVAVPDERIDKLTAIYNPAKTTYAKITYFLPGMTAGDGNANSGKWAGIRDCDALLHVVGNYNGFTDPPLKRIDQMHSDMLLNDLVVIESRLEKLDLERKRGKTVFEEEYALLGECRQILENGQPIISQPALALAKHLRGYTFLTAKPVMIMLNNNDDDDALPDLGGLKDHIPCTVIRGRLEHEIARMDEEDAGAFLAEYGIGESAMHRIIQHSYDLLGLISFLTVGEDEVRAWTIRKGTAALEAADVIHSDIKKGFIRAEVVAYDDLMEAGSHAEARNRGQVRLEGREYIVRDGDIINFRFNV